MNRPFNESQNDELEISHLSYDSELNEDGEYSSSEENEENEKIE